MLETWNFSHVRFLLAFESSAKIALGTGCGCLVPLGVQARCVPHHRWAPSCGLLHGDPKKSTVATRPIKQPRHL
jgi:hypothetical protein